MGIFFVSIGFIGNKTNGFEDFYLNNRLSKNESGILKLVNRHTQYDFINNMFDDNKCTFWDNSVTDTLMKRFQECSKNNMKAIVILGDSHAMNLFNIFGKSNIYPFIVGISRGGCRIHDNHPTCHYDKFDSFLIRN